MRRVGVFLVIVGAMTVLAVVISNITHTGIERAGQTAQVQVYDGSGGYYSEEYGYDEYGYEEYDGTEYYDTGVTTGGSYESPLIPYSTTGYSYPAYTYTPAQPSYTSILPGVAQAVQPIIQSIIPQTQAAQPTCSITASPASVAYNGSVTLYWISQNAQWANLTNAGIVNTSGSWTFNHLTGDSAYTLNVSGNGGSASCSVEVSVASAPLPSCSITATPSSINLGQPVTIAWSANNSSAAVLAGQGAVPLSGSTTNYPGRSGTYTLTVQDPNGETSSCSASVAVQQAPLPVRPPGPQTPGYVFQVPSCTIAASPSAVYQGTPVALTWSSAYATRATLTGVGSVGTNGSISITPSVSRPIVLTVANNQSSGACSTYITVNALPAPVPTPTPVPIPTPQPPRPTCTLKATPSAIAAGMTTQLSWGSSYATSATLSGMGAIGTQGSVYVEPTTTQTYTLGVAGDGGARTCTASVIVVPCPSGCFVSSTSAPPAQAQTEGFWQWLMSVFFSR